MFKFLLLFMLLVFGTIFLLGGLTFLKLFRRVQDIRRQFNNAAQGKPGTGRQGTGSRGHDGSGRNGQTVYNAEGVGDPRTHADRNKKIFPKDEGEYVDFVEEK